MQLKFFKDSGHEGLMRIERDVNRWLKEEAPDIYKVETHMCSVAESQEGETNPHVLVSIWYME